MKRCTRCILNENIPGINFDENGICNFCRQYDEDDNQTQNVTNFRTKFTDLIQEYKDQSSYDCIAAYSGGKDSTYTLHVLKNKYDLNTLAFTYDHWFQSKSANQNINKIAKKLNVDIIRFSPNFAVWKKIIKTVINNDFYSAKSIQRASDICTTCISIIRFSCLKIAIERRIPFIIFGMSPGQAPLFSSIFKTNAAILKSMQNLIYKPLEKKFGKEVEPYFLAKRHFKSNYFPYIINPLAFLEYNEDKIFKVIKSYGWQAPLDTDTNSTNCLLNSFAIQSHLDKYGFHPYAFELSGLVRKGMMSRSEALEKVLKAQNEDIIKAVKSELGIY